ncbi:4-hydroxy-3-methylbut-2-enyl diphosphate reductase [Noviherbaspirillum sp.]|uniref:4-hydroxy-3-methylbut-2-enyl diphosphate reductase n=1 Tax=Noviherbaspirillum sp. TaxID=1926288 RepID=UPI002FE116B1
MGRPEPEVRSQYHRHLVKADGTQAESRTIMDKEVLLAQPRGFCAGVDRAIEIVERALAEFGAPIYVRHEIVHNAYVVADLRSKGAIFIEELQDVPAGNTVIFSAHGVSKAVQTEAEQRGLRVFDATCPLVTKVHVEVAKMRREGREIIMIGHDGHPEVEGTMGQAEEGMYLVETCEDVENLQVKDPDRLAYVSQTTLSIDDTAEIITALKRKFPSIVEPKKGDICYATTNRQEAVKFMAPQVELVIVVGSPNSSNSNRLREVAEKKGVAAHMVDNAEQINPAWLEGKTRIGVTAGASAPEILVQAVIDRLKQYGAKSVRTLAGVEENVTFPMPKGLAVQRTG